MMKLLLALNIPFLSIMVVTNVTPTTIETITPRTGATSHFYPTQVVNGVTLERGDKVMSVYLPSKDDEGRFVGLFKLDN